MQSDNLIIRQATSKDLEGINWVVEQAVNTWKLPERVKRLVLPSYLYNRFDLKHMQMQVATERSGQIIGLAAWEDINEGSASPMVGTTLLHGLYVSPARSREGIGSHLLNLVEQVAAKSQKSGILVKAHTEAVDFFLARGYRRLSTLDINRDYQNQLWKRLEPNP